jgi:hypothetical protein
MRAEISTILRAVAADFFFNCWYLEIPSDSRIRHIPRYVHYHAQAFNWKHSRIILFLKSIFAMGLLVTQKQKRSSEMKVKGIQCEE